MRSCERAKCVRYLRWNGNQVSQPFDAVLIPKHPVQRAGFCPGRIVAHAECPLRSRPIESSPVQSASICVQNKAVYGSISGVEASKANCINRVYGAGDANRTHVRSLGSLLWVSKNA